MTIKAFVKRVFATPCEKCPIRTFCKRCTAVSCTSTAKQYYRKYKQEGVLFTWPENTDSQETE